MIDADNAAEDLAREVACENFHSYGRGFTYHLTDKEILKYGLRCTLAAIAWARANPVKKRTWQEECARLDAERESKS